LDLNSLGFRSNLISDDGEQSDPQIPPQAYCNNFYKQKIH